MTGTTRTPRMTLWISRIHMTGTTRAPRAKPPNSRIPEGIRGAVVQPMTTSVKVQKTQGFLSRLSESHFQATTYNYVSKLRHAASRGEVGEKCAGHDPRRHTSPLDPDHFQGRRYSPSNHMLLKKPHMGLNQTEI